MLVHDPSFQHRLRLIETGTLPAERGNREGGKRVLYRVMLAPRTPLRRMYSRGVSSRAKHETASVVPKATLSRNRA